MNPYNAHDKFRFSVVVNCGPFSDANQVFLSSSPSSFLAAIKELPSNTKPANELADAIRFEQTHGYRVYPCSFFSKESLPFFVSLPLSIKKRVIWRDISVYMAISHLRDAISKHHVGIVRMTHVSDETLPYFSLMP